ncbi:hypothetical protein HDU85_004667 [Gaertneriomyces sp. JEL0708]|nr:hypothetical protein HDU85_004667 [Gaertneriomyces sp. JEL0708]
MLGVSVGVTAGVLVKHLRRNSGEALYRRAYGVSVTYDQLLFERYSDIRIIASLKHIRNPATPNSELQLLLDETKATFEFYSWIGIADMNGIVRAATDGILAGVSVSARPWYQACLNADPNNPRPYLGDVHDALLLQNALNLQERLQLIDVSMPLFDANGVQIGVVGAHLDINLGRFIERTALNADEHLYVLTEDEMVQAPRTVDDKLFQDVPHGEDSAYAKAGRGLSGYQVEEWPSGKRYLVGYTQAKGYRNITLGWRILVRKATSDAYTTSRQVIKILGITYFFLGLVLVVSSYMVAHLTTAPLVQISRAADSIRKRAALPNIPTVKGYDEIARLSYSLNALINALISRELHLKRANEDLRDKIELIKLTENHLRESEENFRSLTDSIQEAFIIVEIGNGDNPSRENLMHLSPAFTKMFGIPISEMHKDPKCWLGLVFDCDRPDVIAAFENRMETSLSLTFRVHPGPLAEPQAPRHIALRTHPSRIDSSKHQFVYVRVFGVFQDITELKTAQLESMNKSSWVRQVGHEIRNPLAATFTMIHLLLETELTQEQTDLLLTIKQSNDNSLTLINSILDLAKLEAGEMTLENIPFNLCAQTEDVLELMAPQAQAKGLRVGGFVSPLVHPWVKGDSLRLRQVIINLFTNAVKFTKTGHVLLRIELAEEHNADGSAQVNGQAEQLLPQQDGDGDVYIRVSVSDTGIGIAPDNQGKLFKEFQQAESSTSRMYGGTGLGLSIVRRLVQMMGGEVGIVSAVGRGSTFWFTARLAKQTQMDRLNDQFEEVGVVMVRCDGKRVMLVSKWKVMAEIVGCAVIPIGGELVVVESLEAGLERISSGESFHVALVDEAGLSDRAMIMTLAKHVPIAIISTRENREKIRGLVQPDRIVNVTDPIKVRRLQTEIVSLMSGKDMPVSPSVQLTKLRAERRQQQEAGMVLQDGTRILVMLVEDNLINQKAVSKQLERITGAPPLIAGDGQACLDILTSLEAEQKPLPDLIFMDVCMPVMDGLTACDTLVQKYSEERRPAIVMMTANALPEDYARCMQMGADSYLLKPASRDLLKETMSVWWRVVRERRLGRRRSASSQSLARSVIVEETIARLGEGKEKPKPPSVDEDS